MSARLRCLSVWGLVLFALLVWVQQALPQEALALRPDNLTETTTAPPLTPPPFGLPFRTLHEPGGCRFLSFSADGSLLASTNECDEVGVYRLDDTDLLWVWSSPELLKTSLGDLIWPATQPAAPAWSDGTWSYPDSAGWPGGYHAIFGPVGCTLAIAHNPTLSHTHVILATDYGPQLRPGFWQFGGYVHFFDDPEFAYRCSLENEPAKHVTPLRGTLIGGLPAISAFAFSLTGYHIATGSSDGVLRLWDAGNASHIASVQAEVGPQGRRAIRDLDFAPDGRTIATIGDNAVVRLWSVPSLALQTELPGHTAQGYWVEISPDGLHAASAAWDGTLRTWDLVAGVPLKVVDWSRQVSPCPIFRYGHDGRSVLFGATAQSGVVGLLDAEHGRITGVWSVPLPDVKAFELSPNGERMAAGDRRGTILVWRTGAR